MAGDSPPPPQKTHIHRVTLRIFWYILRLRLSTIWLTSWWNTPCTCTGLHLLLVSLYNADRSQIHIKLHLFLGGDDVHEYEWYPTISWDTYICYEDKFEWLLVAISSKISGRVSGCQSLIQWNYGWGVLKNVSMTVHNNHELWRHSWRLKQTDIIIGKYNI